MPNASRACGDRICRTGVFGWRWRPVFRRLALWGARRSAGRRDERFFDVRPDAARRVVEARDDERREGEVFVAIGRLSLTAGRAEASSLGQASMITGRITGLRCVTSTK